MKTLTDKINKKCIKLKNLLEILGEEKYNLLKNSKEICQFTLPNKNFILPKIDKPTGIYFFEIKNNTNFKTFKEWIDNFKPKWEENINSRTSKLIKYRIEHHLVQNELKEWIPFYIGVAKDIETRLRRHMSENENDCSNTTSALKLRRRKKLKNEEFRIKIVSIENIEENYDMIMPAIELYLRDKINPIVGKK